MFQFSNLKQLTCVYSESHPHFGHGGSETSHHLLPGRLCRSMHEKRYGYCSTINSCEQVLGGAVASANSAHCRYVLHASYLNTQAYLCNTFGLCCVVDTYLRCTLIVSWQTQGWHGLGMDPGRGVRFKSRRYR